MQALPVLPGAPLTDRTTTRPPTEEAELGPLCGPPQPGDGSGTHKPARPPLWPRETSTGGINTAGRDPNPSRGSFLSPPQQSGMAQRGDRCWGSLRSPGLCSQHALYKPRVNDPKHQEVPSPRNSPHQLCGPCLPRGPRHRPAEDALQRSEREPPRPAPASPCEATVKA